MKAVQIGSMTISQGLAHTVVAGGTESMSNCPYYLPQQRWGSKYGNQELIDGIVKDGLWDVYNQFLMGEAAEICADEYNFSREDQDNYAISSYTRAQNALKDNTFESEIVPVKISGGRNKADKIILSDEEISNVYKYH